MIFLIGWSHTPRLTHTDYLLIESIGSGSVLCVGCVILQLKCKSTATSLSEDFLEVLTIAKRQMVEFILTHVAARRSAGHRSALPASIYGFNIRADRQHHERNGLAFRLGTESHPGTVTDRKMR
jgi:hypothetical protein